MLDAMRQQLISKNVASEIALNITEAVKATLVGQKLASFTRVKTMVTQVGSGPCLGSWSWSWSWSGPGSG